MKPEVLNLKIKTFLLFALSLILALSLSYALTLRYFPIEPDVANSPIVWRGFLAYGFSTFKDWVPTPDNWYFTTYPINFLFFTLMNSDGIQPLILSTSFFVGTTAFLLTSIIYSITKSWLSILALLSLTILPAYVYTYGFAAHPFSHYSTHFFGVLAFF